MVTIKHVILIRKEHS